MFVVHRKIVYLQHQKNVNISTFIIKLIALCSNLTFFNAIRSDKRLLNTTL